MLKEIVSFYSNRSSQIRPTLLTTSIIATIMVKTDFKSTLWNPVSMSIHEYSVHKTCWKGRRKRHPVAYSFALTGMEIKKRWQADLNSTYRTQPPLTWLFYCSWDMIHLTQKCCTSFFLPQRVREVSEAMWKSIYKKKQIKFYSDRTLGKCLAILIDIIGYCFKKIRYEKSTSPSSAPLTKSSVA